ncbi:putative 4-hydroxyphenylacetate permease,possible pseudogene, pointmutations [Salmonella enterica subsp. enterica serovar Bovismorbificans str. 3114]|nr:putative 4-hydroxyphenylacetate permease,possible pseudogene, pointmutations [Salmonella enterica subsp. enterica serovar Bovismorbificans str. 3114]
MLSALCERTDSGLSGSADDVSLIFFPLMGIFVGYYGCPVALRLPGQA